MRGLRFNIPTKFFGLNKSDVDTYFDDLTKKQSKDLNNLSEEIDKLYDLKNKLLPELQNAKKEEIVYEDEVVGESKLSGEVMNDALKRIEKTIALINMLADEEANQLMEKAYDQLVGYDKMADKLHKEIEENKEKIEALLGNVVKLLKQNVDDVTSNIKDKPKIRRDSDLPSNLSKNVIELFEGKINEEESIIEKNERRKMTADGSSLDSIQKLFAFKNKYLGKDENEEEKIVIREKPTKNKILEDKINLISNDMDYFDKIDDYEDLYDLENTKTEEIPKRVESATSKSDTSEGDNDIKKMRNALIIGKIAGDDLLDSNNNVIIPKGKTLNEDDITLAEKESKLPELIINMTLQ